MIIKTPVFSRQDVTKFFPKEPLNQTNTQLHRLIERGSLVGIKRGFYAFSDTNVDEFVVANKLYLPSYVSLESVLNSSGIIPDITSSVTSVTPITSKKLITPLGTYLYSKISKNLYFGFTSAIDEKSGFYYFIATPEKALLDYIYIRRIRDLTDSRLDMANINKEDLFNYSLYFPEWVRKVLEDAQYYYKF